jgi:O-antigen/teichoic acid export membrane protein
MAATGLGQSFVSLASAIQAVLVGAIIGTSAGTDGFFAAYGLYALMVVLAQSWRTTIVARLTESGSRYSAFNHFCGAAVLIFLASGVLFVALGAPIASLLGGGRPEAEHVAREALLILWPAVGGQMVAALAAAMLGLLGNYGRAAFAFPAGGILSIGAFLALEPSLGLTALSLSILVGTAVTLVLLVAALLHSDWRPSTEILQVRENARLALLLLGASTTNALVYLSYLISLAFAAQLGEGAVTVYTYAYYAQGFFQTFVGSSVMIVLAAPIASTWDRRPMSLRPYYDDIFRTGMMIVFPVAAAAAFVGEPVALALLRRFTDQQVHELIVLFLVLVPGIITAVAVSIPTVALFTLGRYRARAIVAAVVVALHTGFCAIAVSTGSIAWLAAAASLTSVTGTTGVLWLLYGSAFVSVGARLIGQLVAVALPAAACFGVAALLAAAAGGGDPARAAAFLVGLGLYVGWIAAFMPPHRTLALRLAGSLRASHARGA